MPARALASYDPMTRILARGAFLFCSLLAGCAAREPAPAAPAQEVASTWQAGAHRQGPQCVGLARADELLCRADRLLIQARVIGDHELVACYRQRGAELRAGYRAAADTRALLDEATVDQALHRERLDAAEHVLERSYGRLEGCERPTRREADTLRVTVPALPADG